MSEEKVSSGEPGVSGETRTASTVPRLRAHNPQPLTPPASLDVRAFRRTMGLLATGVTVITTHMNGSIHGMTANAVTSVSLDPLLMLVAINRRTRMCNIIQQAGEFAINILSERQDELSRHFAGAKTGPQPASLRFEPDPDDGAPYIPGTLAAIRCRIERVLDGGDHVIVLGGVVHFADGPPASPLLHFGDRYCSLRDLAPSTLGSELQAVQISPEAGPTGRREHFIA
jgi:flavin reductase